MTIDIREELFKPSWVDRFKHWVAKLPVSAWILYFNFGIALILVQILFLWLDEGYLALELLPVIIFNGLSIPFLLALIQVLDNQAVTALESMRPVLSMTEQEFNRFEYKLANMPLLASLISGFLLMLLAILTPLAATTPTSYAALEQLPVFAVIFHIIDKLSAFLFGVVLYHTVRQLRLVNTIDSELVRVNLYQRRPLQAFSKLTASTAIGLLVFVYGWMLINPELLRDPLLLLYTAVFTILAVSVFVWPLWGIHRLMQAEKDRALREIDLQFETLFSDFNELIQNRDYATTEGLTGTIASLDIQRRQISDIPTWPWSSETARIALTAIALPLILMVIQYFVLQALDR